MWDRQNTRNTDSVFLQQSGNTGKNTETEPQKGAFDRTEYNRAHNRPAGAGRTWDAAEDEELKREFDSGMKIAEIARQHDRTYGAIQARLKKQGLVE